MNQVAPFAVWQDLETGELHQTLPGADPGEVVTWGQVHSWLGPAEEFIRRFKQVQPPTQPVTA